MDENVPLRIRMFGPLEAWWGGERLALGAGKPAALLSLLLLRANREVRREWIAETLWPEHEISEGLVNLRQRLADLRRVLGPAQSRLTAPAPRALRFDVQPNELDLLVFDRAIAQGAADSLAIAVAEYTAPLLEGIAEVWVLGERERRQKQYLESLERLADDAIASGSPAAAAEWLERGVEIDLFRQTLHRSLMQALAAERRWEAALQVYVGLRRALVDRHGAEPEAETTSLYQELRARARREAEATNRPVPAIPPHSSPGRHTEWRRCRPPAPITRLIGREGEIQQVEAGLGSGRLVTLTGLGGSGKTRLAIEIGVRLDSAFADGACFIDLSTATDEEQAVRTLATALGIGSAGGSLRDTLAEALSRRHALLILDNCEQLNNGWTRQVRALLANSPHLRLLATSRQPLGLAGERIVPVPPLAVSPSKAGEQAGPQSPAQELFLERALALRPDLPLTEESLPATAEICRLMDGLPLGLEIAAGLTSHLAPGEIVDFLRAYRLTAAAAFADAPSRHSSIETVLAASFALLNADEQRMLPRLSVLAGSWTREAAEQIGRAHSDMGEQTVNCVEALRSLVTKSLLSVDHAGSIYRYRMLDLVRAFVETRLDAKDLYDSRRRHMSFFAELAGRAEPELTGPAQSTWINNLQSDLPNLMSAIETACRCAVEGRTEAERAEAGRVALRMTAALGRFWQTRGYFTEARRTIDRALEISGGLQEPALRADALGWSALFAEMQSDYEAARASAAEAADFWSAVGDSAGLAGALGVLALTAKDTGHPEEARELFERSLEAARTSGHRLAEASALGYLGIVAQTLGDREGALRRFEESLALRRTLQDRWGVAASLNNLGLLAMEREEYAEARSRLEKSIALRRTLQDRRSLSISLNLLGRILMHEGDLEAAELYLFESLSHCAALGDRRSIAHSLDSYAELFERHDQPARAVEMYAAAGALRTRIAAIVPPEALARRAKSLQRLREKLGAEEFDTAWSAGARADLDSLISSIQPPDLRPRRHGSETGF